MNTLCSAVKDALTNAHLFHPGARLLCAVSGGADSTVLVHALSRLRAEAGYTLCALHVQHGLRGEDSLADERFVQDLCAQLCIPLTVEKADLHGSMEDAGMETLARSERRRIFAKHMTGHFDALLLAHHMGDQAETVLMHLMRGSGMHGLCGMQSCAPFAGGVLLRPLLGLSKEQILQALLSEQLPHREDESNQHPVTPRNRIRLSLLPEMEQLYPAAAAHIAQAACTLSADEEYLLMQADQLFDTVYYGEPPFHALAVKPLLDAHPALVRRVLRRAYITAAEPEAERALSMEDTLHLERLLHAPSGETLNLPGGWMAVRGLKHVHITRTGPQQSAEAPQPIHPETAEYRFSHCLIRQDLQPASVPGSPQEAVLSPDILALHPVLRIPQPDDVIRPLGAPGSKPLRRFFTDRKADPYFRYQLPALAHGREILWIPGLCAAEALRLPAVPAGSIRLTLVNSSPFDPHQSKE